MTTFDHYAAYYDLLYQEKDYEGEVAFVADLFRHHGCTPGALLELGCGTGLHALALARRGISVTGIDVSTKMIALARQRLAETCRSANLTAVFETGDAQTIRVGRKFDAVVSLFHVVSYQTTNKSLAALFDTAAAHLSEGGIFVFDFWYGPAVLTERPNTRVKRMESEEVEVVRIAEPDIDVNGNIVDVNYTLWITHKRTGVVKRISEIHRMRYLFRPEVESMLASSGFRLDQTCAWMTKNELNDSTWSAVAVATRVQ